MKPSPSTRRESRCEKPMDFESSASTPRARVSDRVERTAESPDPPQQGIAICSSNAMGVAPQEQPSIEKSAVGCDRQNWDSGAGSVAYSCMDYRFYISDGTRRVPPVDVDVPAPAVPRAVVSQGTTAINVTPDRGVVDSSVEQSSGAPKTQP